jgi:hypothetical protein
MKLILKILKWTAYGIGGFIFIAIVASLLFGKRTPSDGQALIPEQTEKSTTTPKTQIISTPEKIPAYSSASEQKAPQGGDIVSVGEKAFLRIAGNSDKEQVIFLSPDPDTYSKEMSKMSAVRNDPQALYFQMGELAGKGWIGVSNGTQVIVLDKKGILDPMYQVRIMKGVRSVDADKVGQSGWTLRDFISKN